MLIQNGYVLVNGKKAKKNGLSIAESDQIEIIEQDFPWVGRGALKLLHAINTFAVDIHNKIFIDVGASTGGFTEVLLESGAQKVYAVDVGTGQLVEKIKNDPKVIALEQTDIRNAQDQIPEQVEGIVIDVSFISLTQILQPVYAFLKKGGICIALVKPQFEVKRTARNKKGVVKSAIIKQQVLKKVIADATDIGFTLMGQTTSPIHGGDGNEEFLIWLKKS